MNIFEKLGLYFQYPFVRYALIVTVLISICAALVGVTLVLKRLSNIGDGLSHIAFGAMSIGLIINSTNNLYIILPVIFVIAFILLKLKNSNMIKGDSALAMMSVFALALAYFLLNVFNTSNNVAGDVCTSLFGSTNILTLSMNDVIISVVLCLATILVYVIFYNKIFVITFDENFAKASGIKTQIYDIIIAASISLIIVIAINLVGSLLVTALLIFPSLSAMRITSRYRNVIIFSVVIGVINALIGILVSILMSTPVGATIVLFEAITFVICFVIGKIKNR
jgi:zinc transport system permease protein